MRDVIERRLIITAVEALARNAGRREAQTMMLIFVKIARNEARREAFTSHGDTTTNADVGARHIVRVQTDFASEMRTTVPQKGQGVHAVGQEVRNSNIAVKGLLVVVATALPAAAGITALLPAAVVEGVAGMCSCVKGVFQPEEGHADKAAVVVVLDPFDVDLLAAAPGSDRGVTGVVDVAAVFALARADVAALAFFGIRRGCSEVGVGVDRRWGVQAQ